MPASTDAAPRVAVIGGGVAGLAVALNLRDRARESGCDLQVTVLEKEAIGGGNLRTLRRDGWQLEWGPNGFLDNEPATLRLIDRLDLRPRLQRSGDAARRRFLLLDGRLQEIPTSPAAFLRSRLLSTRGKLRMVGELFVPARRDLGRADVEPGGDETIFAFGTRRLGREFAEVMLDPMVKGIFGGDARRLSLAAAFPRMVELERDHGGLFKAMFFLARRRKRKGQGRTDAGPGGVLHSFDGGMAVLPEALTAALEADPQANLHHEADVQAVRRDSDGWRIETGGGGHGPFTAVVDASPAHAASGHVADVDTDLAAHLARIPFAPMAVIALGFRRAAVAHDLDGFGLLVPSRENRDLLGALWTSSIFPGRAPADMVLVRCMAGGSGNPAVMELDDDALTNLILAELRTLLGLRGDPAMVQIIRHTRAIAQYLPGHLSSLKAIDELAAGHPGLFFSGSSYRGISVNACVKEAENLAPRILARLTGHSRPAVEEVQP